MKRKANFFRSHLRACLTALCLTFALTMTAQNQTVKGTVTDQNGEPVVGATVKVKGAKTGTVTNVDGQYTLSVPASSACTTSLTLGFL